eukprot:TRINITY_DN6870_c0_g1_i2.p1 TRINITY_DN6870_c0_g1~~TRINITY_DN6870_c0_g1_i2.p1  ORF type:complete len:248 (+),score=39.36 TRINITY_DN6870_c0_g1_i2:41-784(+)
MSWLQVVLLTVLLYMVRSGDAQCSVVVVNNVKKFFLIDCASIETALAGGSLSVAEWKVMCNNCVPQVEPMKATLFLGCDNEAAKFEEVKLSCGTSCKTTDAPETTVPSTSAPCPVCPETPVPTVATTPSPVTPEDSSGSGTSSVSLSGPIATVFIVGVCLIVCIAASSIWYQYIRKSPEEKAQDEKLRNFNILEVQPRYANANALQSPTIAPSYAHSEPEGMSAFDGRSVHSGYHNVGNDSRVLSVA